MAKLKDYSGEYRPDIKLTDFTQEALVRLLNAAGKLYLGADGMWVDVIKRRFGDEVALSCSKEMWETNWKYEVRRPCEAMKIKGNDVTAAFKHLQIDPGFAVMFTCEFNLINKYHGIFTVTNCDTLNYCELYNNTWLQKLVCEELDEPLFQRQAAYFNPKIRVTALRLPPRKSKNEICCKWEYKLEPQD